MSEKTGTIDFVVAGETYQTWYRLVGDLKPGIRPVVALHGGPGIPNPYMYPFEDLTPRYGLPVVFYDQIGAGKSSHLPDKPASFWTVELFMNELENVLAHFGIADDFYLLGHSWGGMLAADWIATRQPKGVKRLVLASTPASMPLWAEGTNARLKELPQDIQDSIEENEENGTTDSPEYQKAIDVFYHRFICRLDPWPKTLLDAFAEMGKDDTVYKTMAGPSEFNITGSLKTWSVLDRLHKIACPTLLVNGEFDEGQDVSIQPFFEGLEKVKWVQLANCSHIGFSEEPEKYIQVVGDFLTL